MKKIKKVMAMLLAMVMVLGMTVTTVAAADVTITVKDENGDVLVTGPNGVQLYYVQVIKPDTTKRTGWTFIKDEYATAYIKAFGIVDNSDAAQIAIDKLIEDDGKSTEVATALSAIVNNSKSDFKSMNNPEKVSSAGIYVIKAMQNGYTYNNMAAYVGFGPVEADNYPELTSAELTAKRTPTTVTKETTDEDKAVAVGDIVTYTIKTTVPYIDSSDENKSFIISDTITGAEYYLEGEDSIANVQMGADTVVGGNEIFDVVDNSFTIDLSELIHDNNDNAGKNITVTYTAKITGTAGAKNISASHVGKSQHDSTPVEVYTGIITLKKIDEENPDKLLPGAGFEVTKDGTTELLKFTADEYDTDGKPVAGKYTYNPDGDVTLVYTGEDGILELKGLDVGKYNFKEKVAPEGYHIADTEGGVDVSATLTVEDKAIGVFTDVIRLPNTKLSSLPSTGGIGTTIFTIGGCVIMIAAAGLFFASRRKTAK